MQDLQQRLDFPRDEILLFLAEADMNADGKIEYEAPKIIKERAWKGRV